MRDGSDGHTGVTNPKVNEGNNGHFQFVLSYLKQASGNGDFIIHAHWNQFYLSGLNPWDFLLNSGFAHYEGNCPFYSDKCIYTVLGQVERDEDGMLDEWRVQSIHEGFNALVANCDKAYNAAQHYLTTANLLGLNPALVRLVGEPIKITVDPSAIPPWVEDVKFPALKTAEAEREKTGGIIDDLSEYLVLLCGDGNQLEMAVVKGLRTLGLKAELAERGATIDVLAETQDGTRRFGFEVTGTPEGIKKKSNKLGQVVEFERIKERDEKTILLANTFKATPIAERTGKEHFTQPAVDFLTPYPVLMMTGWDLYRMVGDVLEEKRKPDEIAELIHSTTGVLEYGNEN